MGRKRMIYAKRIIEKSGLKPEEFQEKLEQAKQEFIEYIRRFRTLTARQDLNYWSGNVLVDLYNPQTGKFTFILIDPY